MSLITIPKAESGVIRVFAISRPISDMARMLKQWPKSELASEMLSYAVTPDDIELFAVSDLEGVGLPAYLRDGYDIDQRAIQKDRNRLSALDGYVLLLFSRISNDGEVTLNISADLTLIGTYSEPKPDHSALPIETTSADLFSGTTAAPKPASRLRLGSSLTALTALAVILFIWWILQ